MGRLHRYEQWIVRGYLRNLLRTPYSTQLARQLVSALDEAKIALGLRGFPDTGRGDLDDWLMEHEPKKRWRELGRLVEAALNGKEPQPSPLQLNLVALADLLELDALELRILGLCVRYKTDKATENLIGVYKRRENADAAMVAFLLGAPVSQVQRRLSADGRLTQTIMPARGHLRMDDVFERVSNRLCTLLTDRKLKPAELERMLARPAPETELLWGDYDHVAKDRDLAARILAGALTRGDKGVNVLLYGPPGTGKTALARLLGDQLGARVVSAGEEDEDRDEPTRSQRLAALQAASAVARRKGNSLVLFDDMDDLLEHQGGNLGFAGSRVFIHRLLENNQTPTLWTSNYASGFDQALLRRMTFAMELRVPPTTVRSRVLERVLVKHKLPFPAHVIERMAREYAVAPALAENAARAAAIAGGSLDDAKRVLECSARLAVGGVADENKRREDKCTLSLLRANVDLVALTGRLAKAQAKTFSVCLSGPPGTGKSSYARYLAARLGMEVLQKRASDLIAPFVGASERNIAAAFREAIENNAVLVFDEADSLLRERSEARHSWEITQVNEMLTWMEIHPLPFICTTNLMDALDKSSLRRFTYKVELNWLERAQIAEAFELYFGVKAPESVLGVKPLTPGDFAVVARRVELEGCAGDADVIAGMLAHEAAGKREGARVLGFGC